MYKLDSILTLNVYYSLFKGKHAFIIFVHKCIPINYFNWQKYKCSIRENLKENNNF